jgi:hypothetical protein
MISKYQELQEKINIKIQELQEKLKLHHISFNEHQTWGHIGDLEYIKKEITEITNDFSFLYTD